MTEAGFDALTVLFLIAIAGSLHSVPMSLRWLRDYWETMSR